MSKKFAVTITRIANMTSVVHVEASNKDEAEELIQSFISGDRVKEISHVSHYEDLDWKFSEFVEELPEIVHISEKSKE